MFSPRGWWLLLLFVPLAHADIAPGITFAPQQCSAFQWSNVPGISERAAIVIPVTLGKKIYYFQLDTGAYLTYLKGDVAQKNGWLNSSDHAVSLPAMTIA
ncbi:hypothetical protein, partial [Pseudomonas sp.]|uniref:hypothetical protein n=1 Tax=Pseudomonas sp. TaxID=306 RepID=UPI003D6DC94D